MNGYLQRYKRSRVYRAYLRHGIRTWAVSKRLGIFSIFSFGFFVFVWWMLIHLPAIFLGIFVASSFGSEHVDPVLLAVLLSFAIFLPIAVSVICDLVPGYLACLSLAFGNKVPADRLLLNHQQELADIENSL